MLHRAKDLERFFGKKIEMGRACSTHEAKKNAKDFWREARRKGIT
jgi:hypothetical protein